MARRKRMTVDDVLPSSAARTGRRHEALEHVERSALAGRLTWLLMRRATARGTVSHARLLEARHAGAIPKPRAGIMRQCQWWPVGPRNINGRVRCLAIHPNGQTLYAGSADGGVWKSTDAGQSWTATMDRLPSLSIGALALDPAQPDTIYAGTGEPLFVSHLTDYAWSTPGAGVYRSVDGGQSWATFGAVADQFIYRIAVDPHDPNNVLCAGFSMPTTSGGLSRWQAGWTVVSPGVFSDVLFDPNNPGVAYAAKNGAGVFRSTNSGQNWFPFGAGLPAHGIGRITLSLARSNSDVLYAKIEASGSGTLLGVFRMDHARGGAPAWVPVANPGVDGNQLWWCSHIVADPDDVTGMTVYAGGLDLARSADGGATWELISKTTNVGTIVPTHADHHDLVFDPANSDRLYIANDGGVFTGVYTAGAIPPAPPVPWQKVSTGLAITQFYDLNVSAACPAMFGGGCQDNGTVLSSGGKSWRFVHGGDGSYLALHPTDPYTMWVEIFKFRDANGPTRVEIRRSTDGGFNFTRADANIQGQVDMPVQLLTMDQNDPAVLFAGTDRIFRTANGDAANPAAVWWDAASPVLDLITEITIAPSSSLIVYAGTLPGRLYRAENGGAAPNSFTDITPTVAGWPLGRWLSGITVDPADPSTIYVTFLGVSNGASSDHVWKGVLQGGVWTWNNISSDLRNVPVSALALDPATPGTLYVSSDVGVSCSTNDGGHWDNMDDGLPNVMVVDLDLDHGRRVLRAATHGRGMYEFRLDGPCLPVDVFVRDHIVDPGDEPSVDGQLDPTRIGERLYHWQSCDIKVDAPPYDTLDALVDGVEFDDPPHRLDPFLGYPLERLETVHHDNPLRGKVNHVYVQVHNRGSATAAQISVKLLWADAGAGLPLLPLDFWTGFTTDTYDQTDWRLVGNTSVSDVTRDTPRVVMLPWTPPVTASDHACLLLFIDCAEDPLLPLAQSERNVDVLTQMNKRVAQKNVHLVSAAAIASGRGAWAALAWNNAIQGSERASLRIDRRGVGATSLRLVTPGAPFIDGGCQLLGFRPVAMKIDEFRTWVATARDAGAVGQGAGAILDRLEHPLVLEADGDRAVCEVRDVRLPFGARMPAVVVVETRSGVDPPDLLAVDAMLLYSDNRPAGGSTFLIYGLA